jgi:signal transduction histidine kinase
MHTRRNSSINVDHRWTFLATLACAILFAVLIFVAVVQYRWIADLRYAERHQLEVSLKATADRFADEFVSELLQVTTAFQLEYRSSWDGLADQLKDSYEQWVGSAQQPRLIKEVWIVRAENENLQLYRFEPSTGVVRPGQWLPVFDPLKKPLSQPWQAASKWRSAAYPNPVFLEAIPALAVPFVMTEQVKTGQRAVFGWSVAQLDRDLVINELLPKLFASHFAVGDPPPYRVAVASAAQPNNVLYNSAPFSMEDLNNPDLAIDLISEIDGHLKVAGPQKVRIDAPETPQWRLFVKHRTGSLDAAVEGLRRRNLGVSGAILLMLAASAVLIVVAANRARRLGQMEVEFAAAVSHELRTPLAVIQAAAYNLQEGVVEDRSQVRHYANLVQDAGRRLSKLVDEILLFAETQSEVSGIRLGPVRIQDVIETVLQSVSISTERPCPVQLELPADLPQAKADPVLLTHCIQNLVNNALKYGDVTAGKPLRISAEAFEERRELQIQVSDDGPGISPLDIPHIFKPFFRGKAGDFDRTGTGLGLAVVHRLMSRLDGRVTVETSPHAGTTFTLHLPMNV